MKTKTDLLTGSISDKILRFAIPLAITGILQQLFNAADVMIVGRFASKYAMAAVGSNTPVIGILVNLFIGISVGVNVVIARCIGQKKGEGIRQSIGSAVVLSLCGGCLLALLGQAIARPLLSLMSVPDEVLPMALAYFRIYTAGMPAILLYNFEAAIFRAGGDTKTPLACLLVAGILNVGLNLFFVIVLGRDADGVATATVAALMGMECVVFMGEEDTRRQALNVYRMKLLGSEVIPVTTGTATLKDAVSEAMREWTSRISDTHYCLGSVMGPHPFPTIVRDFQAVISREIRQQMLEKEGRLPDAVLACVGGGSNAIGSFYHFIDDPAVRLIGCEAAGRGVDTFETAATIATGRLGIFHGMKSYFCQDEYGQIAPVYSISAGLDYPGVGPEHAYLHDIGRAEYVPVTDDEAVCAFEYLARTEGIIPAIESAHAVAYAMKLAPTMEKGRIMVITISGRGDKDCAAIARYRGEDIRE